ncbi:unnamed protein product [Calicophoron daubneyi]|uniref:Lebercilin domain-containing protein n=1 Tax=Calicophoron daubneyi TaxID=300641 RepID=A0AAV2T2U1_CALDB
MTRALDNLRIDDGLHKSELERPGANKPTRLDLDKRKAIHTQTGSSEQMDNSKGDPRQRSGQVANSKTFDLTPADAQLLGSQTDANSWPRPPNFDIDRPLEGRVPLDNWDFLRLGTLGPGWEQALKGVPVNRREALNLLIIMKKKLVRAASELTFYKERVTILQEQLIYQKRNEEKLVRLGAAFKMQVKELQNLRKRSAKVPGLERTVLQQEELISRLENYLDRQRTVRATNNRDQLDNNLMDQLPSSPSPIPQTSDRTAAAALRSLSNENETLRQTVQDLGETVRNLVIQQQDEKLKQKQKEESYKEDLAALKENQEKLARNQENQTKQAKQADREVFQASFDESEKLELYRMLDRAEMRIKSLEEELETRERRNNSANGYSARPGWKYSNPDRGVGNNPNRHTSQTAPYRYGRAPPLTTGASTDVDEWLANYSNDEF